MKKIILGLILLFSFSAHSWGEDIKEIQVKEATIYLQGAKVYGETLVQLKEGKNTIKIVNLPNDINEQTYKVYLNKYITLLGITPYINNFQVKEKSKEESLLHSKNKSLQKSIALLEIEVKTIIGEQQIIQNHLKLQHNDKVDQQTQLEKLTAFYSKRMLFLDKKLLELNEAKGLYNDSLTIYQKQLAQIETFKANNQKEILLEVLADKAIDFNLGLSYLVNNAGWVPTYDIKVAGLKKSLEIIYKGRIYQRSGQDWKNVKLWISTYKPLYHLSRPILQPLYVAEYTAFEEQPAAKTIKKLEKHAEMNSYQLRNSDSEDLSPTVAATANDATLNMLYELHFAQTILSQDKHQYVLLDRRQLDATFKYHAVPKINQQVFLMAFVKDWQQLNFIDGAANVFFEDNFVGQTMIQTAYLKDEFPISLGVDERIVMKRNKLKDKTNVKNGNAQKWETEAYEISIRNGTKENISIEILDQLPISEHSKIAVKSINLSDGKLDEKTGSILWERNLPPGTQEILHFSYEVKYPKEMKVYYFNR